MKRVVLYTNTVSPHQLPLANELICIVGADNFKYIFTQTACDDYAKLGWSDEVPEWCVHVNSKDASEWLETSDVLLSGLRCFDLLERRATKGLKNFYMTERWLKPPIGMLRLFHPQYFGYARRLCRLLKSGAVTGLPIGIHAARDMARLCGFVHGKISCLFNAPELDFERKPGGRMWLAQRRRGAERYCLDRMRMWGYFVKSSEITHNSQLATRNSKKILWVGRLLGLKHVDTIIRAVGEISSRLDITLNIYGSGPEEERLKLLAAKYGDAIQFHPPVPIDQVRQLMREHDVYVFASNGYEGWGAVVSEALEEGMKVLGSYEAGACATILPKTNLFHANDWKRLVELLTHDIPQVSIGDWTAKTAAKSLFCNSL